MAWMFNGDTRMASSEEVRDLNYYVDGSSGELELLHLPNDSSGLTCMTEEIFSEIPGLLMIPESEETGFLNLVSDLTPAGGELAADCVGFREQSPQLDGRRTQQSAPGTFRDVGTAADQTSMLEVRCSSLKWDVGSTVSANIPNVVLSSCAEEAVREGNQSSEPSFGKGNFAEKDMVMVDEEGLILGRTGSSSFPTPVEHLLSEDQSPSGRIPLQLSRDDYRTANDSEIKLGFLGRDCDVQSETSTTMPAVQNPAGSPFTPNHTRHAAIRDRAHTKSWPGRSARKTSASVRSRLALPAVQNGTEVCANFDKDGKWWPEEAEDDGSWRASKADAGRCAPSAPPFQARVDRSVSLTTVPEYRQGAELSAPAVCDSLDDGLFQGNVCRGDRGAESTSAGGDLFDLDKTRLAPIRVSRGASGTGSLEESLGGRIPGSRGRGTVQALLETNSANVKWERVVDKAEVAPVAEGMKVGTDCRDAAERTVGEGRRKQGGNVIFLDGKSTGAKRSLSGQGGRSIWDDRQELAKEKTRRGSGLMEREQSKLQGELTEPDESKRESEASELERIIARFSKLLLGEDMSGHGKGVCSALAISNAIVNLSVGVFGQLWRLEPLGTERKAKWRREIEWLLSVGDHIVELVPSIATNAEGTRTEVMECRQRYDLVANLPALRKLDSMLIEILDSFVDTEFWYERRSDASTFSLESPELPRRRHRNTSSSSSSLSSFREGSMPGSPSSNCGGLLAGTPGGAPSEASAVTRHPDKWWLPEVKVPAEGLSEDVRKALQLQRSCAAQILKASMAINSMILSEMHSPDAYLRHLPKTGKVALGSFLYNSLTADSFEPEKILGYLDFSKEHIVLEAANRLQSASHLWRLKVSGSGCGKLFSSRHEGTPSDRSVQEEKWVAYADRADLILMLLHQRCPGMRQTTLESLKILYNKDVGLSILEAYSRVLESLSYSIVSCIDEVLHADSSIRSQLTSDSSFSSNSSTTAPPSVALGGGHQPHSSNNGLRLSFSRGSHSSSPSPLMPRRRAHVVPDRRRRSSRDHFARSPAVGGWSSGADTPRLEVGSETPMSGGEGEVSPPGSPSPRRLSPSPRSPLDQRHLQLDELGEDHDRVVENTRMALSCCSVPGPGRKKRAGFNKRMSKWLRGRSDAASASERSDVGSGYDSDSLRWVAGVMGITQTQHKS